MNTMTFSKIKVIGKRTCNKCGSTVNIIETIKDGEIIEVSDCLNCETIAVQENAIRFKEEMDKRKNEIMFERYSLIPEELLNATFYNYHPKNESQAVAKSKCEAFANNFAELGENNSLLLQGTYGIGKSHLSYSVAKHLKNNGYLVIFVTVPELLNLFRDSYGKSDHSEIDILVAYKKADLIILDDLGSEYVKVDGGKESWAVDKLYQIINSRVSKPVIYTTNLSSAEIIKKYGNHGGRIVSRMMNGTNLLKMTGKDQRVKG